MFTFSPSICNKNLNYLHHILPKQNAPFNNFFREWNRFNFILSALYSYSNHWITFRCTYIIWLYSYNSSFKSILSFQHSNSYMYGTNPWYLMMMYDQELKNDQALKTRPLNKYNSVITFYSKSRWNDLFYLYI